MGLLGIDKIRTLHVEKARKSFCTTFGPACDYARPKMRKNEAARFVKDECKKIMIVLRRKKEREESREDAVSDSDDSSEDSDSVQFPENPLEEASFDEV